MLPSLLARDIQQGLKQFLVTGFEPSDAFFHGLMQRFVDNEPAWMKGPYLQAGLPFRAGPSGNKFFGLFETQRPGYTHQELAWQRLSSQHMAANTLVATGTGSGKTECFLYPVLDHCARAVKEGPSKRGVKALVIYPMNALATDQARRFAEVIASTPAFSGLRVGLFVGGLGNPGAGMVMTATNVITNRDILRKNPPDILLTNYKMLDYLLLRPKDRQLWARNTPTTLRYVVVDELHTFDGAQGTDLALLLRRLRARLQSPEGQLICVGTSATLGGATSSVPLREYARQIFGAPFSVDSVITESRLSVAEFLSDATTEYFLQPRTDFAEVLDPRRYQSQGEAVAAWFEVFFPDLPAPTDVANAAWRVALGDNLKQHLLFANLLKLLKGGVVDFAALQQQLQGPLPAIARPHIREVLDALLVLVAWARAPGPSQPPVVNLRVQVWMRELRRMVARVTAQPDAVDLRSSADLKTSPGGLYLPLIQCSECHTTGWLSRLPQGSTKVSTKLDEIYNTWFAGRPEAVRLYAGHGLKQPQVDGLKRFLCTSCGNLQGDGEQCHACGHNELVAVFQTIGTRSSTRGQLAFTWHDGTCPACGGRDRQILLGARNATLGSQVVEHSWASLYNDDKKLIAFSDSVQDAAHRAGFFGARTYANTVRTGLARAIDYLAKPTVTWADYLAGLERMPTEPGSPLFMPADRFVAEFIGPNMTWQRDWAEELMRKGALPTNSRLPERVRKRLGWQAVSEFTYLSHRGRNLDRIGKAALAPDIVVLQQAVDALLPVLREQFGAQGLDAELLVQWLWGFVAHLRRRGAVWNAELSAYARDGRTYVLSQLNGRNEWMPPMGERTPRPILLTLGQHRDFDKLTSTRTPTWFDRWVAATLGRQMLLAPGMAEPLYLEAIKVLEGLGLLVRTASTLGDTLSLAPTHLLLHAEVLRMQSSQGKRGLTVPANAAEALRGMPCLDATQETYDSVLPAGDWWVKRYSHADLRRVVAAEHTGLLERGEREELELRFKNKNPKPWYENLLSATPTLEMGVDIGDLSSVLLCSIPPNQANYLQRIGRAGRRDGNALTTTLADGASPHDLHFFDQPLDMLAGEITPPGVFLKAAEVLRRQLFAFCLDDWVGSITSASALPDKTSVALDAVERLDKTRFPYSLTDHVLKHELRLLQSFLALLGSDIDERVTERLTEFMQGTGDDDGMRVRLLKLLEELTEERRLLRKRAEQIKLQIAAVAQKPQDESTQVESDTLRRERDNVLQLVKEINQRELLNALTDGGLIPNYAFPEAGIELKSVLWRKKSSDDRTEGAYVALGAIKYERPASSALSEFAPENRFYANQRRVEVDQINMGLAKLEWWRLCPACHHMENLEIRADAHGACPRCGESMWADQAQRRQLLRFRQAIANSDDTKVRIDDSADDREPKFYVRQLLADFDPKDVKEAWRLKAADLPFGFEFLSRVTFRDVNFGELSKPGDSFKVADKESSRPGFKLCRSCGKVQTPPRRHDEAGPTQQHSFDCDKRDAEDPANLVDCLYLYREFTSEAMRILVPYTSNGVDDEVVQSFMAALQLGLKTRFGGRVDHLRMVTQDEPGRDDGPRRQYVMLYDSVPGGTGYLHQLLAKDAGTLADVLRMALAAITSCPCNSDPEKDGCYRCVYQYRLGRKMELVSRSRAHAVLTELVAALPQLEKVPTISNIFINPNFDSALEARFVESLRRLGGTHGLPIVKLVQDIVNGKSGFLLEVGLQRYWVEPQRDLGTNDGVAMPSRPDFILWPAQSKSTRKPIAVFCDGWAYHKTSLRDDARKRSALVASRGFWVWSVTHDDVKAALLGDAATDLDSPLTTLNRHAGGHAPPSLPRAENQAYARNAVAQLLSFLASDATGLRDVGVDQLRRNAAWATFLMVAKPGTPEAADAQAQMLVLLAALPQWMRDVPVPNVPAVSRIEAEPSVRFWWPQAFAIGDLEQALTPGLLTLDDDEGIEDQVQHQRWRRWLAWFNTWQVLPGFLMATRHGIQGDDCEVLIPARLQPAMPDGQGLAQAAAWAQVIDEALEVVRAGLAVLAAADAEPPITGYEYPDERGDVLAEAELAWPSHKLVVMLEAQIEFEAVWAAAGWTAIAATGDWVSEVLVRLKATEKSQTTNDQEGDAQP